MDRLKRIADYLIPYKYIADIGCDHGYLLIEAFKLKDDFNFIAIDNKKGPLSACINNLKTKPYFNKVRFSLSSGITDIDSQTEVLVLAGMGGILITEILKDDLKNVKRIITCANRDNYEVRKEILKLGFHIYDEDIILERNKYYQIIVFDKSNDKENLSDEMLYYGPILTKKMSNVFKEYLTNELNKLVSITNYQNIESINYKVQIIRRILNEG